MNRIFLLITFCALISTLVSCGQAEEYNGSTEPYFQLKEFMANEVDRLNKLKPKLEKKLQLNGEIEIQNFDEFDWEKEFQLFSQADINKTAWIGKYSYDSMYRKNDTWIKRYEALDKDLKTQWIQINFKKGEPLPMAVQIKTKQKNLLYELSEDLLYQPAIGYTINSKQKILFTDETVYRIEGFFR